jgi:hypothetical protein
LAIHHLADCRSDCGLIATSRLVSQPLQGMPMAGLLGVCGWI